METISRDKERNCLSRLLHSEKSGLNVKYNRKAYCLQFNIQLKRFKMFKNQLYFIIS